MANAQERKKICNQRHIPLAKNGLCVESECQAKCVERHGTNGKGTCYGTKEKNDVTCFCGTPC